MAESTYTAEQDLFIFDNSPTMTYEAIGEKLGRSRHQVRGRHLWLQQEFRRWVSRVQEESKDQKVEQEITDDAQVITCVDEEVKSVDDLIRVMKIDLKVWKIDKAVCNKWGGFARTSSFKEGPDLYRRRLTKVPLYQVKVWLVRIDQDTRANEDLRRQLVEDLKVHAPAYPRIFRPRETVARKFMAEISIPDHHFGKLCWGLETGHSNYNLKIAEQMYLTAVEDLLAKIRVYPVELILLPIGNDMLHVDGRENQTTNGTPQDVDGRWQKAFRVAKNSLVAAIDRCRQVAPVEVLVVPGNHDLERMYYLGEVIEAHYSRDPEVTVDNLPTTIKFKEYGQTLLGFAHGDRVSEGELPMIMAGTMRQAFARTTHWEWHLGHRHTRAHRKYAPTTSKLKAEKGVDVNQGVHVRILPALCPPDAWHAQSGYVLGPRASEAYLWEYGTGYAGHLVHNPIQAAA